ncbi:carboxypeptidase regulatory-like domain-containing protein [Sorangium sp. So ce542]|uniref:carboxypeptidase regulatory-like domain-containing protein n=1 Tax=Sorangium sp. So ce542 TaxID=3133316 RepID=UPI003F60FCCB
MMQPNASERKPSRRPLWIAVGLLLTALAGVTLFLVLRPNDEQTASERGPAARAGKRAPYRNRAILRSAPAAKPEARPTISGHVYGTDGNTIAGVTVVATTFEVAGNVLSTVGSVKSDDSGRFELTLPDGTYQLSASVEGYGTTSATAHSGEPVSLVLPRSGVIEGRVLDERGEPVRRFAIDVLSVMTEDNPAPPPLLSRTFESPDGSFRIDQLPSWDIVVRATAAEFAPAFSPMTTVRAGDVAKMDLTLSRGCTLTGRVVDSSGAPLPGVYVDAESLLVAGEMSDVAMEAAAQAETEDDGSFSLPHVPQGTIVVRGYDGSNAVSSVEAEVSSCDKLSPVKLVMSSGGSLSGVARDADGKPIDGARITLAHRTTGFVNTVSDAGGRFHFEQIPPGAIRVMARHGAQVTMTGVNIEEGKNAQLDITLAPKGTGELRGRVTAGGKPLPGARVMVATPIGDDGTIGLYYPVTAEDGSYRVSELPSGPYIINVESTSTGAGLKVKPDEVTTVDLSIIDLPGGKDKEAALPPPQ